MNLVSRLQQAMFPTGHKARGWDVKRWRYRLFATAGKLIIRARKIWLLIPEKAPEADTITTLLEAIHALGQQHQKYNPQTARPRKSTATGPARQFGLVQ